MENTGRIRRTLLPSARRILFDRDLESAIDNDLPYAIEVDRAHLVMLSETGIVPRDRAARLLRAINRLRADSFSPLRDRIANRGLYLLYEDWLIETEGAATGGILQTARSRNDLNATVHKLKLRWPLTELLTAALRLEGVLLLHARQNLLTTMPAYTHGQAAVPITWGHYLAGLAQAVARDLDHLLFAARDLERCPLGAGAVGGATLPIDSQRTAALLGFTAPCLNSVDAVASRDLSLRILAVLSILGVTLSRAACDLWRFVSAECGILQLPDELVGSSSAMPQKRNPFLLEHILGRTALLTGAFAAAAGATHGAPFTNSIAAGSEATRPLWQACQDATDVAKLLALIVSHAIPDHERMRNSAISGFTVATEVANLLMCEGPMDFRSAHKLTGELVTHCVERGHTIDSAEAMQFLAARGHTLELRGLTSDRVAASANWGGGPGALAVEHCLHQTCSQWAAQVNAGRERMRRWKSAQRELERVVADCIVQGQAVGKA